MRTVFILAIIAVIVFLMVSVRFRNKILRLIDYAISKSVSKQILFLAITTGLAFGFLLLFIWVKHGSLKLGLLDWLFAYVNPGSSYTNYQDLESSEKLWAIIIGFVGMIFLSGMLISVLSNIIERRVDKVKNGHVHYYNKDHVIIIGFDQMSIGLIGQLAEDKRYRDAWIILQTTQEVPKVRHELFSRLATEIEKKVTIVSGNRTSGEDLEHLQINRCREVFLLGESDDYDNDSLNVECVRKIYAILSEKPFDRIVRCNVLFDYQSTFAIFQRQDMEKIKDRIDFVPFNYYEMWAQKIFVEGKYHSPEKGVASGDILYMPLDYKGITADSEQKVQIVVIGMTKMGIALGIQAAHLCHFPNFVTKGIKTRITFMDEHADREMNFMMGRYRRLFDETDTYYSEVGSSDRTQGERTKISPHGTKETFTDIEFEFIKARLEYPVIQDYLADLSRNRNLCLTIAVCFSFPPKAIAAGLYMPDEVYDNEIPILVQQEISYCTLDMLAKDGKYKNVRPFGMLENCFDLGKADDRIPMRVNYVYSKGIPEKFPEEEIVTMWRSLRTALKWSNRYYADSIQYKMRSFNHLETVQQWNDKQIELAARVEHNRWNIEKLLIGYRATTPAEKEEITNNPAKKNELKINCYAHNDICSYDDLQADETGISASEYDRLIIKALPLIINTDE